MCLAVGFVIHEKQPNQNAFKNLARGNIKVESVY